MRNKLGVVLLIIGGIMMIVSSAIGSIGIYEFLHDYISGQIPPDLDWVKIILNILIEILRWIANTGGGAIIVGAILIMFKQYRFGKWLVGIGLTFGTLALIIWGVSWIVNITDIITNPQILGYFDRLEEFISLNTGLQITGDIVAIIGRIFVKKSKEVKDEKEEDAEISEETETSESVESRSSADKFCPNCGSPLPLNAIYCNECGNSFENR